jgi:hypothetical protein
MELEKNWKGLGEHWFNKKKEKFFEDKGETRDKTEEMRDEIEEHKNKAIIETVQIQRTNY